MLQISAISASIKGGDDTQPQVECTATPTTSQAPGAAPPQTTAAPPQTTAAPAPPQTTAAPPQTTAVPGYNQTTAAPPTTSGPAYDYYYQADPPLAFIIVKLRGLCGTEGDVIMDPNNPSRPYTVQTAADCSALAEGGNRDPDAPPGGFRAFAMGVAGGPNDHQCKIMKLYPLDITEETDMQAQFETWEGQAPSDRECAFGGGWRSSQNWDFFAIGTSGGAAQSPFR